MAEETLFGEYLNCMINEESEEITAYYEGLKKSEKDNFWDSGENDSVSF